MVVGAGASKEAHLPTGKELRSVIAQLLDIKFEAWNQMSGDATIAEALREHVKQLGQSNINSYRHAAQRISEAMPLALSIDNFIDAHAGEERIELCGKLAIIRSILDAERMSLLYIDPAAPYPHLDLDRLEPTWFNSFWQLLTESCTRENIASRF